MVVITDVDESVPKHTGVHRDRTVCGMLHLTQLRLSSSEHSEESGRLGWRQRTSKLFLPLCQPCARLEL